MFEFTFHACEVTGVQGDGKQHAIAGASPGHRQADELLAFVLAMDVAGRRVSCWIRGVTQAIERRGDRRKRGLLWIPYHSHHVVAQMQTRRSYARHQLRQALDQPHARRAMDAFESQIDRQVASCHAMAVLGLK